MRIYLQSVEREAEPSLPRNHVRCRALPCRPTARRLRRSGQPQGAPLSDRRRPAARPIAGIQEGEFPLRSLRTASRSSSGSAATSAVRGSRSRPAREVWKDLPAVRWRERTSPTSSWPRRGATSTATPACSPTCSWWRAEVDVSRCTRSGPVRLLDPDLDDVAVGEDVLFDAVPLTRGPVGRPMSITL
jgi:hypothetical protein